MRCVLPGDPGGPGIPSLPSRPKRKFIQSVIISVYIHTFSLHILPLTERSTKYTAPSSAESGGGRSINEGMVHG